MDHDLANEIVRVTKMFRDHYSDGHTVAAMINAYGKMRAAQIAPKDPNMTEYGRVGSGGKG